MSVLLWSLLVILAAFALYAIARSIVTIGPAQVGLASLHGNDGAEKGWLLKRSLNADSVNSTREMEGLR